MQMKKILALIIIIIGVFTLLGTPLITSVILSISVLAIIIIFSLLNEKEKPKKRYNVFRNNTIESKPTDENEILVIENELIEENIHDFNNLSINEVSNTNLSNQIRSDEKIKQEKLGRILNELTIYINNKDVIDNETSIKSEQTNEDSRLQEKLHVDKEVDFEIKKNISNILDSLIHHKRDKCLNISNTSDNLYIDDKSIIDITNMESYNLDFNNLASDDIPIDDDRVEIEWDLDEEQYINTIIPDYTELPFIFIDRNEDVKLTKYFQDIPYWSHTYIYSVSSLEYTSQPNQKFYKEFKKAFYRGIYYDLGNNSNYYFTLLFDLLNEYEKHKNIIRLENQLYILSKCYPKTMTYAIDNLLKILDKNNESSLSLSTLIEIYPDYHWRLGDKYGEKLDLSPEEKKLLNDSVYSSTNFTSIEKCQSEVIKLFLYAIRKWGLNKLEEVIRPLSNLIIEKYFKSQGYIPPTETIEREIYNCIYKSCENYIRVQYGFRGRVYLYTSYYTEKPHKLIAQSIIAPLENIISTYNAVSPLDEVSEIQLNLISPTRWRDSYEKLINKYDGNIELLINGLKDIYLLNENNINIKQMYYDTMKLVFLSDSVLALKLYLEYISINMQDPEGIEKALPKYICKKIFQTTEQQDEFEVIIKNYKNDKDKVKTYSTIDELFLPKRKKLNLNHSEISKITVQHSDTIKLLNEVMDEDQIIIEKQVPVIVEVQSNSTNASDSNINSILDSEQQELLDIFVKNNFTLKKSEVEMFAKSKNLMANRLIEKINDLCYEILDDILIEDDEDSWTILEDYLKHILVL